MNMKQLSCTIALLSLFLLGACNRIRETVITEQIIDNVDNVIYSNPKQVRDTVIFIENSENINTLAELVKPMRGRKIFIGIWATWCGPCIAQFRYSKALRKILNDNDIQMLYVSVDRESFHQQWKNMIQLHNLTGKHIRANEYLARYLQRGVPRYMLIDEEGNIIQKYAQWPSQIVSAGYIDF